MPGRPARYVASCPTASFDGRYYARWPNGDKPGGVGAVLASNARVKQTPSGALTTAIRIAVASSAMAFSTAALSTGSGSFVPDYYISTTGSDSNDGLTSGTAWAYTALNTKRATYAGKKLGFLNGVYNTGSLITDDVDTSGLDIEGGPDAAHPTIVQAVNAPSGGTWNVEINPKTAGSYGNGKKGPSFRHTASRSNQGNLQIRGIKFAGHAYHVISIGTYAVSSNLQNIVIEDCEFTDNSALQIGFTDNVDQIALNNCDGAIVRNCYHHANNGWASASQNHLSAVIIWLSKSCVFEYNTIINSGSIHPKENSNQGHQARYNFIDNTGFSTGEGAFQDWAGHGDATLTLTSRIHHNVVRSTNAGCVMVDDRNQTADGFITGLEIYSNTIDIVQYPGGPPPYVESAIYVKTDAAGNGLVKVWNNIICGTPSIDNKMLSFNPGAPGLWDYNATVNTGMTWRLVDNTTGATINTYTSLSSVRAAVAANGGISNFDLHGIQTDSFSFTGTGVDADKYKLSGGPCVGVGSSDGTTGGSAVDMGAWGNSPPLRIGSNLR